MEMAMPLYIKDPEVSAMANRLARMKNISKTSAVRDALTHELERETPKPGVSPRAQELLEAIRKFQEDTRGRAGPRGRSIDKAWIDGLYE